MFRDFPADTVTIDGGEIQCIVLSGLSKRSALEIGGFQEEPTVTIAIQLRDPETGAEIFTSLPEPNDTATLAGRTYRIDRTESDPYGYTMQLDLVTPHK